MFLNWEVKNKKIGYYIIYSMNINAPESKFDLNLCSLPEHHEIC